MKSTFDGVRAGLVIGAMLTAWSLAAVGAKIPEASDAVGFVYVAIAFGLLASVQVIWGAMLGLIGGVWRRALHGALAPLVERVNSDETVDRKVAASILAIPVMAAVVGAAVGATHAGVTSTFARVMFQAVGLMLAAAVAVIAVLLAGPILVGVMSLPVRTLGRSESRSATARAVQIVIAAGVVAIVAGGVYAASLDVFDRTTLAMGLGGALGTALLTVLFARRSPSSILWAYAIVVAGVIGAFACLWAAGDWASSSPSVRAAVNRHSHLVSSHARLLQSVTDRDGDGFSAVYGGADCDDANSAIYPGAPEVPGNGIDESCSGSDGAAVVHDHGHQGRDALRRAVTVAAAAAQRVVKQLPEPPKNLVLLLVDTLRYDHLGFAGYDRDTTPNIDAIAAEASVFGRTYATSPHTPRSIPAIFLSRYPSRTKWRGGVKGAQYNYPKVSPENVSVFELLAEHGHHNLAVTSHFYFDGSRGLQQGFARWDNDGAKTIAESNNDVAAPRIWNRLEPVIEELGARDADAPPFALFVHLFEPHAQWISHKEHPFEGKDSRVDAYDSEVAFADAYVGRIRAKLEAVGLWDDVVFALVSDHGEGFKEHGYYFHGQTLYNEVIWVPMLLRVPGWPSRTVRSPTSIVDLAPTLLDLFGYPIPDEFDGESLEPVMIGQTPRRRPIFAELLPYTSWKEHHKAVVVGDHKLISIYTTGSEELFDLASDPSERSNLIDEQPRLADELRRHLQLFSSLP